MGPPGRDSTDPTINAALLTIREAARRGVVASRFQPEVEDRLLQSIVDATVRLFEAEAASIALFERDPERLEFRVASGPKGAGAVGMTWPRTRESRATSTPPARRSRFQTSPLIPAGIGPWP